MNDIKPFTDKEIMRIIPKGVLPKYRKYYFRYLKSALNPRKSMKVTGH